MPEGNVVARDDHSTTNRAPPVVDSHDWIFDTTAEYCQGDGKMVGGAGIEPATSAL